MKREACHDDPSRHRGTGQESLTTRLVKKGFPSAARLGVVFLIAIVIQILCFSLMKNHTLAFLDQINVHCQTHVMGYDLNKFAWYF